jgi:hypothetical protein
MTHPEDLLADYVDGALTPPDRRDVDAHLASCDRCRREVTLARDARAALSNLAPAPTPARLADRALDEARRSAARSGPSTWYRWATGAAAAAAVLLLVGLVVPRLGDSAPENASAPAADAAASGAARAAGAPRRGVEISDVDYSTTDVQQLALGARALIEDAGASTSAVPEAAPDLSHSFLSHSFRAARAARDCLRTAYPPEEGAPFRLIDARFEDTPAYIGLFRDGSGAEKPAGSVLVVVAAKRDCRVLSTTTAPG